MKKKITPPFLTTSFSENGKKLMDRINNILSTKKRKTGAVLLIAVIAAAAAAGCFAAVNRVADVPAETTELSPVAVLGNDGRGMSDIILVLDYDGASRTLNIIQLPRDTRTSGGGRLGAAYAEGTLFDELALLGFETDKLVSVGYDAFRSAVDAIGGVDFSVPDDMNYSDPYQGLEIDLAAGEQTLDGAHAEMLIRYRKGSDGSAYANGDLDRLVVQNGFYRSFINKLLAGDAPHLREVFSEIADTLETTLTPSEMNEYAALLADTESVDITLLPGQTEHIGGEVYFVPAV